MEEESGFDENKMNIVSQTEERINEFENLINDLPAGTFQDQAHFRFVECCAWLRLAVEQI